MENPSPQKSSGRSGCLHALLIIIIILLVCILGSMWWLKRNVYANEFKPVTLDAAEQVQLETKLQVIDALNAGTIPSPAPASPEKYAEFNENRLVIFSERELNSLIARDPYVAQRVAIDLTDDMISVKIIAPTDPDMPFFGGKTFRLSMGVTLRYENGRPVVIMRGISLGGIPLPSAWWGNIKNRNLVEEFGEEGGFWDMFSKGVEHLEIKDGTFVLKLKE